jgi:hypothetical protein
MVVQLRRPSVARSGFGRARNAQGVATGADPEACHGCRLRNGLTRRPTGPPTQRFAPGVHAVGVGGADDKAVTPRCDVAAMAPGELAARCCRQPQPIAIEDCQQGRHRALRGVAMLGLQGHAKQPSLRSQAAQAQPTIGQTPLSEQCTRAGLQADQRRVPGLLTPTDGHMHQAPRVQFKPCASCFFYS